MLYFKQAQANTFTVSLIEADPSSTSSYTFVFRSVQQKKDYTCVLEPTETFFDGRQRFVFTEPTDIDLNVGGWYEYTIKDTDGTILEVGKMWYEKTSKTDNVNDTTVENNNINVG